MTQDTVKCQDRRLYTDISVLHVISPWITERKGLDVQDTDKCPNRQLYTDISAWITDAKILSVFARTGHHDQYEGHKGSF